MKLKIKKISRTAVPFLTGLGLVVLLTNIFMAGGKRQNLAAIVESFFIEKTLIFARHSSQDTGTVRSVTLRESELPSFERAPRFVIKDANIRVYADVLRLVLAANPKLVILNWLHGAHYDDISYIKPLLRVIDENHAKDKVLLAFPDIYASLAPKELRENYRVVAGEDCIADVNLFCSIPDNWPTWIPGILAKSFLETPRRFAFSYNLPHVLPNFLVNVPNPDSIPDISFTELKKNGAQLLKGSELVTIGPDLLQNELFANNKDEIQKTYIAISHPRSHLMSDGLPYHRFWAAIGQMFIENSTIAVMPKAVSLALALLVSLFIVFILIMVNTGFALFIYLATVFCYFCLNLFGVKYFHFYIPIFDVVYFGLVTVGFSAFFAISNAFYRQYALAVSRDSMNDMLDLKQNFISLISHNLNTPVAKLKGLIEVLSMRQIYKLAQEEIDALKVSAVTVQFLVRTVLLTSSLEEKSLQKRSQSLREFYDELTDYLKQYGFAFDLSYNIYKHDDPDSPYQKSQFDPRFLLHAVLVMLIVNKQTRPTLLGGVEIRMAMDENSLALDLSLSDMPHGGRKSFTLQASQNYLQAYAKIEGVSIVKNAETLKIVIES